MSRKDIFAGVIGGQFGDTINPELLIEALIRYEFVKTDDKKAKFLIKKEFTVYGHDFTFLHSDNERLRRKNLTELYFKSFRNYNFE